MPTAKQKAAAVKALENVGKPMGAILKEVGYSDAIAKNPKIVTDSVGFKEVVKPFVKQMEEERQRLMDSMRTKNLESVEYRDHVKALDVLTKNTQLLTGGVTERSDVTVSLERAKEIENAFGDL